MIADRVFDEIGGAYTTLIHLEPGADQAVAAISRCSESCSYQLVHQLLVEGPSWRERLIGLVVASLHGLDDYSESLLHGFKRSGGIGIVPLSAALAVAIQDGGCAYTHEMTDDLDRGKWDGEVGFALDWLHHTGGMGEPPSETCGPNYGQDFPRQFDFYRKLNRS
jgi:hypothetical protein